MVFHLLFPGIHAHFKNSLQAYTGKSWTLAHEEFLCSLECFLVAAVFYLLADVVGYIEGQQDTLKQFLIYFHTMQQAAFSFGCVRRETKSQKKERLRKDKEWKLKEARRKAARERGYTPCEKRPPWLLLPSHVCQGFDFWILTLKGDTFLSKRNSLLESITKAQMPIQSPLGFDTSATEKHRKDYLEKAQVVMSLLHQNQTLRWKWKNFVTKARILRFEKLNETDPITLEPIQQPVVFHSFSQQKTYTFEAESFIKNLHKKLTHNDAQLSLPQQPKNPYTNEIFTLAQLISLLSQARKYGHSSWAIEAFISSRYDLTSFSIIHTKPLRLHALRTTMANMQTWDAIDTLYDFIKSEHLYHKKVFPIQIYRWAVNNAVQEKRIESWRKLCIKYYETDILMDDSQTKEDMFENISKKTLALCSIPHELQVLRKLALKSRHQAEEDGGSSPRDSESEG